MKDKDKSTNSNKRLKKKNKNNTMTKMVMKNMHVFMCLVFSVVLEKGIFAEILGCSKPFHAIINDLSTFHLFFVFIVPGYTFLSLFYTWEISGS